MNYPIRRSPFRVGWDPFGDLQALRDEVGRMFGSLYGGRGGFPDVDLDEDPDGWIVTARLPGVAPEEVIVEVDDRELSIRARTEAEMTGEERAERRRSFDYRFTIPGEVDAENVDATMDHGLLTIRLPRTERSKRRTIPVGHKAIEGTATEPTPAETEGGGTPPT
ncbi:MAG TPA: Hsp20/alpha crystallin family protein [Micromonosporaceae bacterium]|jgi:HSP20 family protein